MIEQIHLVIQNLIDIFTPLFSFIFISLIFLFIFFRTYSDNKARFGVLLMFLAISYQLFFPHFFELIELELELITELEIIVFKMIGPVVFTIGYILIDMQTEKDKYKNKLKGIDRDEFIF